MLRKAPIILWSCLVLVSCNLGRDTRPENRTSEEYEILSVLYNTLSEKDIPPPFIHNKAQGDSLEIIKRHQEIKDSLDHAHQVVAIDSFMDPVNLDLDKYPIERRNLLSQLNSLQKKKLINLQKLHSSERDSLIFFTKEHLKKYSADYDGIDLLISFSRIAFNESGTEAVVVATSGTSRLDTHTGVFFFKKENETWKLEEIKTISIS